MSQNVRPGGTDQVRWASGLNILAGLWLIVAPFVLGYSNLQSAMWNDIIVGIVVAALAAIRAGGMMNQPWLSWINLILGAWVFISPWVLNYVDTQNALWNNLILGAIIFVLAGWSALTSPSGPGSVATTR